MPLGLTRKEQWALLGTILVILGALAVHGWRERAGADLADVEGQGVWRRLSRIDASRLPPATAALPASVADATASATLLRPASTPATGIDLNSATAEDLERLPGIGPAKAAAILDARRRLGRFETVDQLVETRGIGPATLERLRPYLRVTPVGTPGPAAAPAPTPTTDRSSGLVAPALPLAAPFAGR